MNSRLDTVTEDIGHLDTRTLINFVSLAVLAFIISLEAAVLVPVLPSIAKALNGTTSSTLWAGSSYLLTVAVFQPLIGALSEVFNHQKLLIGSIAMFNIGALICSVSRHMTEFLVGRSIQGIGGGGILALINIIPTVLVSLRQRPTAIMLNQIGYVAGTILGPVLGGIIGQYTTWRWIFYINFPLGGLILPVVVIFMKLDKAPRTLKEQIRQLDYVGATLFLASICSLLLGIIGGGEQHPWSSWQILLPILCGILGLILGLLWEAFVASTPFLCLALFRLRSANAIYVGTFLQGFLLFCQLYYLPVYFEGVRGFSIVHTGLTFLPITITMIIGSLVAGAFIHDSTRLRCIIVAGWVLAIVSSSLLFLLSKNTTTYRWVLIFLAVGAGHGMLMISLNYALQTIAKKHQEGKAMSMYTFMRALGMCIGVAVGSCLLQNALKENIQTGSASTFVDLTDLGSHPELPPALLMSLRYTCYVMTAVSLLGLLLSFVFAFSLDIIRKQSHYSEEGMVDRANI